MSGQANGGEPGRGFDLRQVLADSALVVPATVAGGAVLFLASLYLARAFGPIEFGQFRVVVALVGSLTVLIEFGTGPILLKYVSELGVERTRDLVTRVLIFRAVLFLGLAAAVILFRGGLARHVLQDPSLDRYLTAGAIMVCCVFFDVAKFLVLAHQKMKLYAATLAVTSLAHGVLAAGLMMVGGVYGAIVGWGLAYPVGNAMGIFYLARSGGLARGEKMEVGKILLRYGLPMHVERTLRGIELAVIPVCSLSFDQAAIGALAFALLFYQAATRVVVAINSVLLPKFAQMSSDLDRARTSLRQALRLLTPAVVVGSALAVLCARTTITLIDADYLDAVPIFRILTVYGLVGGYGVILSGYYAAIGRVRKAVFATAAQQLGLFAASYLGLVGLG